MKKNLLNPSHTKLTIALCLFSMFAFAQNLTTSSAPEIAPYESVTTQPNSNLSVNALWDVLFNYDVTALTGQGGYAGVCFTGTEYWVSKWASDTIAIISPAGTFIRKVTVAGVTGIRSLTYDGSFLYAGQNSTAIAKINPNPVTPTLASTITAPSAVRSLSFDATANSGAGGFWISNYGTDINLISRTGTILSTITAASHALTAMYGTAVDHFSPGGPYLWVFDQGAGTNANVVQIDIATGAQTGVIHDASTDAGTGQTTSLAGGVYIYSPTSSVHILVGLLQSAPSNKLFGYDLNITGLNDPNPNGNFLSAFPSVTNSFINIKLDKQNNDEAMIQIFDTQGKLVFDRKTRGINNYLNVSEYSSGMYFVKVIFGNQFYSTRFVKN